MHYSKKEIKFLQQNYRNKGAKYCSKKLNRPIQSIRYKANILGLKVSKKVISSLLIKSFEKPYNKYNVNPSQFIEKFNKKSVYILGLLFADGSIYNNRISLECIKSDIDVLLPIFYKTGNWNTCFRNRKDRQPQGIIRTSNKPLCEFLSQYGFGSHSYQSPSQLLKTIPLELHEYFFRGLVDGDGCFHINKEKNNYSFSLSGNYKQDWSFFTNLLDNLQMYYRIVKENRLNGHKSSCIQIQSKYNIVKLGDYIYKNFKKDKIGLLRKYNKYIEIKDCI